MANGIRQDLTDRPRREEDHEEEDSTWSFDAVFDYLLEGQWVFDADGFVSGVTGRSQLLKLEDPTRREWLLALITCVFVSGSEGKMVERFRWGRSEILDVYAFWREHTVGPLGKAAMESALAAIGKKWPRMSSHVPTAFDPIMAFHALVLVEDAWLGTDDGSPANLRLDIRSATREPWVSRPSRDYFGLALSGGGIRSATFNLGLLQALGEKGVLSHVDYLSTVSGGGYVGGFWSAWRFCNPGSSEAFPVRATGPGHNRCERIEVRHLREFSRFLIPRVGFTQSETWLAVSSVLGGTLISLMLTAAAVATLLYLWCFTALWLSNVDQVSGAVAFFVITLGIHLGAEARIDLLGKLGDAGKGLGFALGVLAALASGGIWWVLAGGPGWGLLPGVLSLLNPPLVWFATALWLLFTRGFCQRILNAKRTGALDRAVSRSLAPALVTAGLSLVWLAATKLSEEEFFQTRAAVGLGSAGAAALFVWLRDWLKAPMEENRGTALLTHLRRVLKPVLPRAAAMVAVVLFFVGVALLIQLAEPTAPRTGLPRALPSYDSFGFLSAVGLSATSLFWFDPARTGLHEFYRARIARCFLGAARAAQTRAEHFAQAGPDRRPAPAPATVEQRWDDLSLGELRSVPSRRPLHLVCCAANNLGGDALGGLYRGARSAVLSPFGISVGNFGAPRDHLSFSAALTASAAAFNSQMGELSMRLGPAVAFLMCALNLRLGLWVPHPLNTEPERNWFPGWYFFLEALGISRSDQARDKDFFERRFVRQRRSRMKLHLSDGGHFENLGIYELVRRHCRYIIASDASADPKGTFTDLGNAIRRVREDFGVEIEIDVDPLRPGADGCASRHAVTGTIHFDGLDGTDKGFLIYFKPNLTGDEPADVLEYRSRQPEFPHDGTGDQFYDEAQWESYRRLGQHAGSEIVSIQSKDLHGSFVDKLFMLANQRLQVASEAHRDAFLRLSERCTALDADIRDNAPAWFRAEFFPEVAESSERAGLERAVVAEHGSNPDDGTRVVYFLMHVTQVMEDVWLSMELERRWAHPLNAGWMNYFRRWTSTPSFRTWWPILRPIYCPEFRHFLNERFELGINEPARRQHGPGARLELRHSSSDAREGLALSRRRARHRAPLDARMLSYELELENADGAYLSPIQVGHLSYTQRVFDTGSVFIWDDLDLVVIPALRGAGIESRFLDAIVALLGVEAPIHVRLDSDSADSSFRSPASRSELVQRISFYKSRGFRYETRGDPAETWLVRPRGALPRA
jgi:hypothetical protein